MPIIEKLRSAVINQIIQYQQDKGGIGKISEKRTKTVSQIQEILTQNSDSVLLRRELEKFITNMNGNLLATPGLSIFDGSKLRRRIADILKMPDFSEDNLTIQERLEIRELQKNQISTGDPNWQQRFERLNQLFDAQRHSIQMLTEKNTAYEKASDEMCSLYTSLSKAKAEVEKKLITLQDKFTEIISKNELAKRFTELEKKVSEQDTRIQLLMAREKTLAQENQTWSERYASLEDSYQQALRDNVAYQREIAHLQRELKLKENSQEQPAAKKP